MSFYADKMFLTPKHLSTVVKEVSGKTAGEWIDSLVILEAKAMLKSSEQSIQEIADELHLPISLSSANTSSITPLFAQGIPETVISGNLPVPASK